MGKTARAQGPALPPWLRGLTLALLALYLALSAYVLWRAAVLTPYSDEIDWIQRWSDFQALGGSWAHYLLTPINFHRMPLTFGLLAFDLQTLGGTNLPLIASGALAVGGMAWLLAREAGKAAPPPLALPAATLAAMLALMAGNLLDAATPICVNYTHGVVFAVLAMILAEGGERRGLTPRRVLALIVAMLAGLGDAVALAVWPVLAFNALRRRDWLWLTALLAAGAAFLVPYASGQGGDARTSTAGALADPLGALRLALNYLMLPWTRLNLGFAWIGGLVVATLGLAAVAHGSRRDAPRAERVAASFIFFTLGTAAMAGLGRYGLPDALNVPLRYGVLVAPLHVGFLIFALPYAGVLWRANRTAAQALIAAALLLATAQNGVMALKVIRASDVVRTAIVDFKAGVRTPEMLTFIHPNQAYAAGVYGWLAEHGYFQRELHLKRLAPAR
ncbi:hypothetical protein LJR219_001578 [Phenylobacterium sp. LjRoot219]|uniref:hypothetical protein n=1 Tax=Phenylobacterium sp. LjRoot219 TaxID=3342283 RepID=UPI003ECD8170